MRRVWDFIDVKQQSVRERGRVERVRKGDISNAYGWINRLSLHEAVRKHVPGLASLCASQFVKDETVAVIQERGDTIRKCELQLLYGAWCTAKKNAEQRNLLSDFLEQDARPAGQDEC